MVSEPTAVAADQRRKELAHTPRLQIRDLRVQLFSPSIDRTAE